MTVSQLAARWSISLAHAYRLGDLGVLRPFRIGKALRCSLADVVRVERGGADAG
jgi:hypothetical protein